MNDKVKEFDRAMDLLEDLIYKEKIELNIFNAVAVYLVCKYSMDCKLEKNKFIEKISYTYDLIKEHDENK